MATDRARRSFDETRKYRSIVAQQGRVTLEADLNEAEEIRAFDTRAQLIDIIGPTGTPNDGFKITLPGGGKPFDFGIEAGTIYVGGLRLHLPQRETYEQQSEWANRPHPDPSVRPAERTRVRPPGAAGCT